MTFAIPQNVNVLVTGEKQPMNVFNMEKIFTSGLVFLKTTPNNKIIVIFYQQPKELGSRVKYS